MQAGLLHVPCKSENPIHPELDSIRIYRMRGQRGGVVHTMGKDTYRDFSEPLIV